MWLVGAGANLSRGKMSIEMRSLRSLGVAIAALDRFHVVSQQHDQRALHHGVHIFWRLRFSGQAGRRHLQRAHPPDHGRLQMT